MSWNQKNHSKNDGHQKGGDKNRGWSSREDRRPGNLRWGRGGAGKDARTNARGEARERERERERITTPEDTIWGRGPVLSILEESPARVLRVYLSKAMRGSAWQKAADLCRAAGVQFVQAEPRALDEMTAGGVHQGMAAVVSPRDLLSLSEAIGALPPAPEPALALLFDHIQDPHNLGAMIRTAEAAGAAFAALPNRRSSMPAGIVSKTSAGASARFPLAVIGNAAQSVRAMKEAGLWCVGLDAGGSRTIYEAGLPARAVLAVGSEGAGLSRAVAAECDEVLSIPIEGGTGSLNASVALAVAAFEWARRNKFIIPHFTKHEKYV